MVQKLLTFLLVWCVAVGSTLAQERGCGTMDRVQQLGKHHPNLLSRIQQQTSTAAAASIKDRNNPKPLDIITIPVVVHVVYNTNAQNISDAQIQSQIDVLNRDYRRLNPDSAQTPSLFKDVAADAEIQFALARRTPDNDPTTGITRTRTSVNGFVLENEAMKFDGTGGKAAWDTRRYLNIWVVAFQDDQNLLGFAQFPEVGSVYTDGVVIDYRAFGTTGTAAAPYNLGRTTTHEVGHWLNLLHIWGDAECGTDFINDTPTQRDANSRCPSFPHSTCNNISDMFMNYMDYTDDVCMNLFTEGQKYIMQYVLNNFRPEITTSQGAQPVEVLALDAALRSFSAPVNTLCSTTLTPVVVLQNRGSQTLTSAVIQYQVDNGTPQTYTWSGSIASFERQEITLPSQPVRRGSHTITARVVSRNGSTSDNNSANDQLSSTFQVLGQFLPLAESFEDPTFPPPGWAINNPNFDQTWERTTLAAKTGTASAAMFNYYYLANGLVDELIMPPVDLSSRSSPTLSFQVAYSLLSPADFSDTLEVWISTDCGQNYERLYQKFGQDLTTATPYYSEDEFVPTSSEWRMETIDLSDYSIYNTAYLKFRHITDFENNLYLDDVLVTGDPVTEQTVKESIRLWPNPTSGTFEIVSPQALITAIDVWDSVGKQIKGLTVSQTTQGESVRVALNGVGAGIYFVRIVTENGSDVRRLVIIGE